MVSALDRSREVARILGLARRPFDPAERGWNKVTYRQGDVLDEQAVNDLVAEADVVVHLASIIMGSPQESRQVNLQGSGHVFAAAARAGVQRLVYTSSVAAYGFHADNPQPLTEDVPPAAPTRTTTRRKRPRSSSCSNGRWTAPTRRPTCCVRASSPARMPRCSSRTCPTRRCQSACLRLCCACSKAFPSCARWLPDPGVPFQLVHHDDVAAAVRAAVLGRGEAGVYNLAGPGELTMGTLAQELGWYSIGVPELAVDALAEIVGRLAFLPAQAQWVAAFREPVIMDTRRARRRLGWRPRHDVLATLRETIAARSERFVR